MLLLRWESHQQCRVEGRRGGSCSMSLSSFRRYRCTCLDPWLRPRRLPISLCRFHHLALRLCGHITFEKENLKTNRDNLILLTSTVTIYYSHLCHDVIYSPFYIRYYSTSLYSVDSLDCTRTRAGWTAFFWLVTKWALSATIFGLTYHIWRGK